MAYLPARGVLELSGEDRVAFLQGLVSNDVAEAAPGRIVWAALLTPQGKWLADFFVHAHEDTLRLDCERAQVPMLIERLSRFRLRSRVEFADISHKVGVHVFWGALGVTSRFAAPDPRLPEAGIRAILPERIASASTSEYYDAHRLSLGLPDGSRDLDAEKTVLLEAGFDELHGISWTKGCYMGQELTARTKYRGLVKRRLVPVYTDVALPARDTPVMAGELQVGETKSSLGGRGMALLRIEALDGRPLHCGAMTLTAQVPSWMQLPSTEPPAA